MTVRCRECGGSTVWDDDAGSALCSTCGTLTDPTQSVLTSHLDFPQNVNFNSLWDPAAPTTLKSFRTGLNWDLSGQGNEAKDRKNSFAMVEFVNSLASSINASSLSPRATVLFNQAMATGRYRWGRKSKQVAGACLSLALREYSRPDALHDVAHLLGESFSTLVRTLSSITTALGLSFTAADPRAYFPSFQAHLSSILQDAPRQSESDVSLPTSLVAQLKPLSLHTAIATATSLATLFSRFGPDHLINGLSVPATACAMFLLALEAELRAPLERLSNLAACLGPLCHTMRSTLMARYKLVQEEVLDMIEQVPWLDKYQSKNGRAKVGKRAIVARGLKDVLLFQEEIWRGRLKPTVELDMSDAENDDHLSQPQSERTTSSVPPPLDRMKADLDSRPYLPSRKRRKIGHKPLHDAAQFLLDPLSAPIPSFDLDPSCVPLESVEPQSTHSASSPHLPRLSSNLLSEEHLPPPSTGWTTALPSILPLTSYILTAPTSALISRHPPTRLQLLIASRGGEKDITDDELFQDGELDTLFRSEQEIESLKEAFGWGDWEDRPGSAEEGTEQTTKKRRRKGVTRLLDTYGPDEDGDGTVEKRKTSKRVNLEALARFLGDPTEEKEGQYDYDTAFLGLQPFYDEHEDEKSDDNDDWQDGPFHSHQYGDMERPRTPTGNSRTPIMTAQDHEEVVINEWRPLSPETGIRSGSHSQYDEEYD